MEEQMEAVNAELTYSVGEVAELTGVTVRTLHHYDEIGLLRPKRRSDAGYRLYLSSDLERLQQILFYRELGFSLPDIQSVLENPVMNTAAHLLRQHRLLKERIDRLQSMLAAVEYTMEVERMGISLTPEERFEVFGNWSPDDYADEVEERWGGSEPYVESQRRAARYRKDDWLRIKEEGTSLDERFAAALLRGLPSDSPEAMAIAEEHRQQITRHFYDCSYQIHRGLAEMFVADDRFRTRYDEIAPGLAEFVRGAILANSDRAKAEG
jgi:MerR family transcriptional regulator, thiopeptide resistance regulator